MQYDTSSFSNRLLVLISTLQGGVLLGLYRLEEENIWPADSDVYSFPLWAAALILPLVLLLSIDRQNVRSLLQYSGAYTLIVMCLAAYLGSQLPPENLYSSYLLIWIFSLTMLIATFKATMYIQQRASSLPFRYSVFFSLSWRNFLVTALAVLFVLAVFLMLVLWHSLFSAIGIDFFEYLFQRDWFLFPVFGFSFGLGIAIFRELTTVIDSITRLLQGLLRFLLPILMLLSVSFLASLCFVGLDVLWRTTVGTALMLWLLASILFMLNAVYQDGRGDTVYSTGMHQFISIGLLTLPILSGLALYGLFLRIDQHGFSVARLYGLTVWLVLSVFALSYLWALVKQRQNWVRLLGPANIRIGLFVLVLALLISTPVVDFRKITLANQMARIETGQLDIKDLDVRYFRQTLGAPGYEAYDSLVSQYEAANPALVAGWKLDYVRAGEPLQAIDLDLVLVKHPHTMQLPNEVKQLLQGQFIGRYSPRMQVIIVEQDLDGDSVFEYVVLSHGGRFNQSSAFYLQRNSGTWQMGRLENAIPVDFSVLVAQFQPDKIKLVRPQYSDIEIGGVRFRVQSQPSVNEVFRINDTINGLQRNELPR